MNRTGMQKFLVAACTLAALALSSPLLAESATWTNVPLVDSNCSNKVKDNPDAHTRECALMCAKSGYGIWTVEGKYLKFDAAGSEKALALLKGSEQKDHLRVDLTGVLDGETLQVESIALTEPAS